MVFGTVVRYYFSSSSISSASASSRSLFVSSSLLGRWVWYSAISAGTNCLKLNLTEVSLLNRGIRRVRAITILEGYKGVLICDPLVLIGGCEHDL